VDRYCDRTLLLLLRTFFDIIRLKKGPEHLPDSVLVLGFALVLFAFAMFVSAVLIQSDDSIVLSVAVSMVGYLLYWVVLGVTGFVRRLVPTIAAIMACGSLLTILMVAAYVMLAPFLGTNLASLVAWLTLMWSVPVKGHIIARAIEQHWYIGIGISLAIYIMQRVAYQSLTATPGG
jgi:hypothetical protein